RSRAGSGSDEGSVFLSARQRWCGLPRPESAPGQHPVERLSGGRARYLAVASGQGERANLGGLYPELAADSVVTERSTWRTLQRAAVDFSPSDKRGLKSAPAR